MRENPFSAKRYAVNAAMPVRALQGSQKEPVRWAGSPTFSDWRSKTLNFELMTLSDKLWTANQDIAQACLEHPFVQGIGDGSLEVAKFADYVGQDAFFLEAFARAYSIAAAKAPDWQGFMTFHALADGVLAELRLHEGYATQWGVDLRTVQPGGM